MKGIIHRDIKPSNVLVTEFDQHPVPKVIDFGIAKAINQTLTENTTLTGIGQVVGTLEYMSPEQTDWNQPDIDTRSDIYSLGVLLYELLTGTTPFDRRRRRSAAWDEMLRIIREEEPPRPSARLLESREMLAVVAPRRQTEPAKLTKLVRGELDWIVMKALEKDRTRRYESASGLASDVARYLRGDLVEARRPTPAYRLRKSVARNKAVLGTAAAVLLALSGGLTVAAWQTWKHGKLSEAAAVDARALAISAYAGAGRLAEAEGIYLQEITAESLRTPALARAALSLAVAYAVDWQAEKALDLFEREFQHPCLASGSGEAELENHWKRITTHLLRMLEPMMRLDSPTRDWQYADALLRRAARLRGSPALQLAIALVDTRLGRIDAAHASLAVLRADPLLSGDQLWKIESLLAASGDRWNDARDWHHAVLESRTNFHSIAAGGVADFTDHMGRACGFPRQWPPADVWTTDDTIRLYTRLIEKRPHDPELLVRLGSAHMQAGNWGAARHALEQSLRLKPGNMFGQLFYGATLLQMGDVDQYDAMCRRCLQQHSGGDVPAPAARELVYLLTARPISGLDYQAVAKFLKHKILSGINFAGVPTVRGMLAYREGKFREALNLLQQEGAHDLYAIASQAFLAMTYQQLGDYAKALSALDRAEAYLQETAPHPDGAPTPWYSTNIVWCFGHAMLREARQTLGRVPPQS